MTFVEQDARGLEPAELKRRKLVVYGAQRAMRFVIKVVAGEKVNGERYGFDGKFIREIHRRIDLVSGYGGELRQLDVMSLGNEPLVRPVELPARFYVYGRWLETRMDEVFKEENTDNVVLAVEAAAAAHYGLTMPEHHPFYNGNGRTARALVNAILMSRTDELRLYGIPIPPLPLLRTAPGKDNDGYVRALRSVKETHSLLYFMAFLASKWIETLQNRLRTIEELMEKPYSTQDADLIATFRRRIDHLQRLAALDHNMQHKQDAKNRRAIDFKMFVVPNYFDQSLLEVK